MIVVCPYDRLSAAVQAHKPTAAISILDCGESGPTIESISASRHLKIGISMAEAETLSADSLTGEHRRIQELLGFARSLEWDGPLLIHCRLGLSRSPAAAYIIQCALSPDTPEAQYAEELRFMCPFVEPSLMMIAKADDVLERDGRMLDAVEEMGSGEPCVAGNILSIPFLPRYSRDQIQLVK